MGKIKILKPFCLLGAAAILSMGVSACSPSDIAKQREACSVELMEYCGEKAKEKFSWEGWNEITETVMQSQIEISEAKSERSLQQILESAKGEIDKFTTNAEERILDNGVYDITDESWEEYVRHRTENADVAEEWIQNVISTGESDDWEIVSPRRSLRCVIAENLINCGISREDRIYRIKKDGEGYAREPLNVWNGISFSLEGDLLRVAFDQAETYEFRRSISDPEIIYSSLAAPKALEISCPDTIFDATDYVTFSCNYESDYGVYGMVGEIKTEKDSDYRPFCYDKTYMNLCAVQLDNHKLEEGVNMVRIYHAGGVGVLRDENKIIIKRSSPYRLFRVTVSGNDVKAEQIV